MKTPLGGKQEVDKMTIFAYCKCSGCLFTILFSYLFQFMELVWFDDKCIFFLGVNTDNTFEPKVGTSLLTVNPPFVCSN